MKVLRAFKRVYREVRFSQLLLCESKMESAGAEKMLQEFYPRNCPSFCQRNEIDPQYDVMIIVPVYNVENYLEQCIDSVLNQKTEYTYQAVFVDDGSTDRSGEILDQRVNSPHVVIHTENRGVSAARNLALRKITGRYVMFLDSDDYLAADALEILVREADRENADVVEFGHVYFEGETIWEQNQHTQNIQRMDQSELYGFPWGKVYQAELLREFCFPVDYVFEDTVMATLLHPTCRNVISVPYLGYFYRRNISSITFSNAVKKTAADTFWMMKYCLEERLRRDHSLTQNDYTRYLTAVRRNWIRTQNLPEEILECIFVMTCDLFSAALPFDYNGGERRMKMLEQAIKKKSYAAHRFLMDRWEIL